MRVPTRARRSRSTPASTRKSSSAPSATCTRRTSPSAANRGSATDARSNACTLPPARVYQCCPSPGNVEARRTVDRVGVRPHPRAGVAQDLRLDLGHRAVGVRADVEQQVAALGDGLHEHRDHLRGGEVIFDALVAVHAERVAEPAAQLPAAVGRNVGHVVLVHRVVGLRREPAVVEHELEAALGRDRARVGDDLVGAPVRRRGGPSARRPTAARARTARPAPGSAAACTRRRSAPGRDTSGWLQSSSE